VSLHNGPTKTNLVLFNTTQNSNYNTNLEGWSRRNWWWRV